MIHDPLCPWNGLGDDWADVCGECNLIARVREDERDNCWGAVAELVPSEFWEGLPDRAAQWWIVKADALAAIEALGGER